MRYEGSIYRPPSEASSLIVQATVGCSHNRCRFCTMYKDKQFRIRPVEEILKDLSWAAGSYGAAIEKVFLADGDALIMKTADLLSVFSSCQQLFPRLKRIGIYGSPQSILRKSEEELNALKEAGLGILYLGIESGSDRILTWMEKGVTSELMIEAGKRVKASGITLSAMVILGLGGTAFSSEHARESARVCNAIQPDYLSLLTLMLEEGSGIIPMIRSGEFAELDPRAALTELREMIADLELAGTELRSNHASNYVSINGRLPEDKGRILQEIDRCLSDKNMQYSSWRRL
jgi:radical SAM superfamily enzyme YgiQ (UPF0313 family)